MKLKLRIQSCKNIFMKAFCFLLNICIPLISIKLLIHKCFLVRIQYDLYFRSIQFNHHYGVSL